jgi:hypothetical protein
MISMLSRSGSLIRLQPAKAEQGSVHRGADLGVLLRTRQLDPANQLVLPVRL